MGIFDRFNSREELLSAINSAISETIESNEQGEEQKYYSLSDDSQAVLAELKSKFESAVKDNQNYRKRAQTAESKVSELEQENSRLKATNEEFSKYNPEKQRDEINRLLAEVGQLKADNKGLNEQIDPLNKIIADYKSKEQERLIDKALIEEATKLGVRPEAMRDVMYRRSKLEVSDIGTIQTKGDGIGIAEFMKSEFDASPLWHPQSQGGGSNPGNGNGTLSSEALYEQAKQNGDIDAMFANAPEFSGLSLDGLDN